MVLELAYLASGSVRVQLSDELLPPKCHELDVSGCMESEPR
jgi:hypothetical protein